LSNDPAAGNPTKPRTTSSQIEALLKARGLAPAATMTQGQATTGIKRSYAGGYPAGSVKANAGSVWRIAIPKAAAQAMLGGIDAGLGGDLVEVASRPITDTVSLPEVPISDFEKATKPWYKKWQTWAILGGVVVGVGGTVVLLR
jgi:hypothetical protein